MNFIPPQDETRLRAAASGVLPNGKPVVVNADGTVSFVEGSTITQAQGSVVTFESGDNEGLSATYDSNSNRVVVSYKDVANSGKGTAAVGTVSGNSISFGTPVVYQTTTAKSMKLTFDSANNKVIMYFSDIDNSNIVSARVGTVSGSSISFGTKAALTGNPTMADDDISISCCFDSNAGKSVVFFKRANDSDKGTACVGTVSGTDITFGSLATFETGSFTYISSGFDSTSNKVMAVYNDTGNSSRGTIAIGTVSGTSVSFGTPVVFETGGSCQFPTVAHDSANNKNVIAFKDDSNSGFATAIVGTTSGTTMSFGTAVVWNSADTSATFTVYDPAVEKVVVATKISSNGIYGIATVSGTSITFESNVVFDAASPSQTNIVYDSTNKRMVTCFKDNTNSLGRARVLLVGGDTTNLTAENYIGMSGGAVTFVNQAVGSPQVFESANSRYISSAFDSSNNKIVITYGHDVDGSKSGKAVVGTVTGNSISFGTPVVFESAEVKYTSVVFDSSNNKFVIAYEDDDNSDYGTAIVGTVSGTTISFGTAVVFESAAVLYVTSTFDTNSNKVVIAYTDDGNSSHGTAIVGTVSGTNISFGSATVFNSGATSFSSASFDSSNNKAVISYCDQGNSSYGTAIVGTVSGTSISFGSEVVFEAAEAQQIGSTFDSSNNKVVVAYQDNGNSGYGNAVVGTVSGTGISFGTAVIFETARSNNSSVTFDTSSNKVAIAYQDAGNSNYGTFISGTVSGTSISFDTATVFEAANSDTFAATFDSNSNKVVIAYRDTGNSNYGTGIVVQTESINRGQVASGSSASVDIIGTVSENQTGLTAGQSYFVQTDGTIALTAGSPSVFAGTAISATKLLVKT